MFYDNRKNIIFKVWISYFYCIIDNYVCADYLCCPKNKLQVENKWFEKTTYNDISGIGIPKLFMNIISCHVLMIDKKSALIFSCCNKLVDSYPSKCFVIHEKNSSALSDVPLCEKQRINAEHIYENYFVMAC